jgi:hypothetical protein
MFPGAFPAWLYGLPDDRDLFDHVEMESPGFGELAYRPPTKPQTLKLKRFWSNSL